MKHSVNYLCLCAALAYSGGALAVPPPPPTPASVTVEIEALASSKGAMPDGAGNNFFYSYTLESGATLTDIIPIQFCLTDEEDTVTSWKSVSYQIELQNDPALPNQIPIETGTGKKFENPNVNTKDFGDINGVKQQACQTIDVRLNTGLLELGSDGLATKYDILLKTTSAIENTPDIAKKDELKLSDNAKNIHIEVNVLPPEDNVSCFMTDSEGLLLANCLGQPVTESGSDAGRFAIVTNRKGVAVASNPGQFYYNVVLHNPSNQAKTVNVQFDRSGVVPQGMQAIHAKVFPPMFSGISQENFEMVNDALPGGSDDDMQGIEIPAGWTLWVNYHLEWSGKGSPLPTGCTSNCADANDYGIPLSVTATFSGDSTEVCESGAFGFSKK